MTQKQKSVNTKEKLNFSSFDVAEAMEMLGLEELLEWTLPFTSLDPSAAFHESMERLKCFDLSSTERAKELLIDEFFKEVLTLHQSLRAWKAAPLQSDRLIGTADYVVAARRRYLKTPLLCAVEAKRDDFEKGLGQCLVEMQACQWTNNQEGMLIDIYGIVTNGEGWKFYKLDVEGKVFESLLFAILETKDVLGALSYIFGNCEENLAMMKKAA